MTDEFKKEMSQTRIDMFYRRAGIDGYRPEWCRYSGKQNPHRKHQWRRIQDQSGACLETLLDAGLTAVIGERHP